MKRIETIKNKKEFNNIIKNGKFVKNNHYVIYYVISNNEKNKYGLAISKTVGKAYIRNRLKRQTRMIIDNNRKLFPNKQNYIIMIRKSCQSVPYKKLEESLIDLIEKIG